jgi:uncharacterized membrane protein YdjX (TVP38/TMEM64 family)
MRSRFWIKIAVLVAVCLLAFAIVRWQGLLFSNINDKLGIAKCWVQKFGILAPLIYIFAYILRPLIFIPATPFAILGGLLFGSAWGTFYVLLGAMCSSVCEFLVVRYLAGEKTRDYFTEKAKVLDKVFRGHGFVTVFLVRLIPNVAFDLQNCILAITPVKFKDYFFGTLLGCLPASIFYSSIGNIALNLSVTWKIGFVVSVVLCLYIVYSLFFSKRNNKLGDKIKRVKINYYIRTILVILTIFTWVVLYLPVSIIFYFVDLVIHCLRLLIASQKSIKKHDIIIEDSSQFS